MKIYHLFCGFLIFNGSLKKKKEERKKFWYSDQSHSKELSFWKTRKQGPTGKTFAYWKKKKKADPWLLRRLLSEKQQELKTTTTTKTISNSTNQLLNYAQFVSSRVLNTSLYLSSYISRHQRWPLKILLKKFFT